MINNNMNTCYPTKPAVGVITVLNGYLWRFTKDGCWVKLLKLTKEEEYEVSWSMRGK